MKAATLMTAMIIMVTPGPKEDGIIQSNLCADA
jgi:hypothetical protein